MDIKKIKRGLLKAARGKRSQLQLSRRMGFSFNQLYRWESDLTRIHWKEFIHLCEICKVDLKKVLKESISYKADLTRSDLFVQHVIGFKKIAVLSREVQISRFILSDWSKGRSEPSFDGVLKLLDSRDLLTNFLEIFPGIELGLELDKKLKSKRAARTFFYENPIAGAAWSCLDLSEYQAASRHTPGFIARHLGISTVEEKQVLDQMEQVGLVVLEKGKYRKNESNFNTRGDFEGEKRLREFWINKGL
jgi:transcriptional regulator with XRE-family HTH domain